MDGGRGRPHKIPVRGQLRNCGKEKKEKEKKEKQRKRKRSEMNVG